MVPAFGPPAAPKGCRLDSACPYSYLIHMRGSEHDRLERNYRAGMRSLARHDAQTALRQLRAAVDACPPDCPAVLARYLYWLAIPLLRLGKSELAVKSLVSAQKLEPRGPARRLYRHMVNDYGMVSTGCGDKDDFRAFFSIQLRRYLGSRPGGRFRTEAERDAVARIIADAWLGFTGTGILAEKSCSDKLELFHAFEIPFPFRFLDKAKVLPGNFRRGTLQKPDARCSCGSGLPYRQCCGRTQSAFGAGTGLF